MIQGNSIFYGSVVGLCEMIDKGMVTLCAEKVEYANKEKESRLYNVTQMVNGVRKHIFLPTLNQELRPFSAVHDNVCQSWDVSTVSEEDPSKILPDDLAAYAYHDYFRLLAEAICKKEGLDPEVFPPRFTTENAEGEDFGWYNMPHNTSNSKVVWKYDEWYQTAGIPTFKVQSALIQKASLGKAGTGSRDNHISFKLALGRTKYNPNQPKPVMHSKRSIKEVEAAKQQAENPGKKTKRVTLSKAAQAMKAAGAGTSSIAPIAAGDSEGGKEDGGNPFEDHGLTDDMA